MLAFRHSTIIWLNIFFPIGCSDPHGHQINPNFWADALGICMIAPHLHLALRPSCLGVNFIAALAILASSVIVVDALLPSGLWALYGTR